MERQKLEKVVSEIDTQIRQNGWVRDAVGFEEEFVGQTREEMQYSDMVFEKEGKFLKSHWEVPLDYPIAKTSIIGALLRKVIRKISKIVLYRYTLKQNAINFSTMQSLHQVQLYIRQSRKENMELQHRCDLLEKRIAELEESLKTK